MNRILAFPLLLSLGCHIATKAPELGDRLILPKSQAFWLVSSAQTRQKQDLVIGGINYIAAVDDDHRVVYISTNDPGFRTPEGLGIDSTLQQVLASGAKAPMHERGWAFHTQLPSGWSVAFVPAPSNTDSPLPSSAKISWFFKRK